MKTSIFVSVFQIDFVLVQCKCGLKCKPLIPANCAASIVLLAVKTNDFICLLALGQGRNFDRVCVKYYISNTGYEFPLIQLHRRH